MKHHSPSKTIPQGKGKNLQLYGIQVQGDVLRLEYIDPTSPELSICTIHLLLSDLQKPVSFDFEVAFDTRVKQIQVSICTQEEEKSFVCVTKEAAREAVQVMHQLHFAPLLKRGKA